jgi:hypothetical protein
MCGECTHKVRDALYCEDCLAHQVGLAPAPARPASVAPTANADPSLSAAGATPPGTARHSHTAVAFLLGFIPGLGAVYNGEYNKAIVHIVIFGGIIFGIVSDLGDTVENVLIFLLVIFPFYMAIDSVRVAKAKQTGEPLSDPFENWSAKRPLGPVILIVLGALFLMNNFGLFDFFRVKQLFLPLLLIGVGVFMLRNRMGGNN